MRRILVDVDTQVDFADPSGSLYVESSESTRELIQQLLVEAETNQVPIVGSVDSHAWDAWEFQTNGGLFPAHCVKGTAGWLRITPELPRRTRFLPMQSVDGGVVRHLVGESVQGAGARVLGVDTLVDEAISGVGIYFEKEVYSLFSNPVAEPILAELVERLGGVDQVEFDVIGFCTGGYCVDAAALGLIERGYRVRVIAPATAPIGGEQGAASSRQTLVERGIQWVTSVPA